jgi:hypothetical protein
MPDEPIDDSGQPQEDDLKLSSTHDLEAFAARLGTFKPRSISLNRDAILFAAGQASCEPVKPQKQQFRGYRAWQGATVAMSLLSFTLGSMLIRQPAVEPQIIIVERQPTRVTDQVDMRPATDVAASPSNVASQPAAVTALNEAEDAQLAEAWKARREMIAASDGLERQLATASPPREARDSQERPLTRSSLLGDQSQETIQRWLKEQL